MREPAPTAAKRCTAILLPDILDYLSLYDVFRAMGVDRLWRDHALNHRTYYGELYLFNEDPPQASEAFFQRLSRSGGRPVSVHLRRDDLRPFMPEISSHLSHIRTLYLQQHGTHPFAPILEALCQPADILSYLSLQYMPGSNRLEPQWLLPADFLANHAPALRWAIISNVAFPNGIPRCFKNLERLGFGSHGRCRMTFVLPNPFERCPNLDELNLSGSVALDDSVSRSEHSWKRLSQLTFSDYPLAVQWPAFRIPFSAVSRITVTSGDAHIALTLAGSLSGVLDVTFLIPERTFSIFPSGEKVPFVLYTVVFSSLSDERSRSRQLEDQLIEHGSISAFSTPSLTDRIARLVLPLEAWDDFAGLSSFGPFNELEELVITLDSDLTLRKAALSKLLCPRLLRLVISGEQHITVDVGVVAGFALAVFPSTKFPLVLASEGVGLKGESNDYSATFKPISSPDRLPLTIR